MDELQFLQLSYPVDKLVEKFDGWLNDWILADWFNSGLLVG